MKSHALMSKRTGIILEGRQVCFADNVFDDSTAATPWRVVLQVPDGWIVTSPEVDSGFGGCWIFMNAEWVEKEFEDLGEI